MELDVALPELLARFNQIFEALESDEPPDAQDFHGPAVSDMRRLVQKIAQIHSVIDAMNFRGGLRAALHHQPAAVFGLDRDKFRRGANFPEKIVAPEVSHEILAVRRNAEREIGHRLQKQGGVRRAIGEVDMKMVDLVPDE